MARRPPMSEIREAVRERYASKAKAFAGDKAESCCGPECCSPTASQETVTCGHDYDSSELIQLGMDSSISLGCGNPLLLADLRPGERVLDLGSGGGLDVLLSARRVAPDGHAFGVDMTDEMLELARANQARAGVENATFLKGTIEQVPLPDGSVDVVISNCVINLAEDKRAVLCEAFRALKPGGRFAVSDMVELKQLPPEVKKAVDAWAGCISGTIPVASYRKLLAEAGFQNPKIELTQEHDVEGVQGPIASAAVRGRKPEA